MSQEPSPPTGKKNVARRFLEILGPGLITGAADVDPAGISTYSVVGAAFGYMPLWTAFFLFPLMYAVQMLCAELGKRTEGGLAKAVRRNFPWPVLLFACLLLFSANAFNIGADLIGMAVATQMVTGVHQFPCLLFYTALILGFMFFSHYRFIFNILKWLTLVLFSYVVAAFLSHPDWASALRMTVLPHAAWSREFLSAFLALLGTTISPYLFFWQTAQEVEEERSNHGDQRGKNWFSSDPAMNKRRVDVLAGMSFSNVIMYFIMLTSASALNAFGKTDIQTFQEVALALRPLAGDGAYLLFTLGIVGTGLLSVPVLAGSAAYAVAEALKWRASLEDTPDKAPRFYGVVAFSMLLGLAMDALGMNAVRMLYLSAIFNGLLAPPLIVLIVLLTGNRKVMGERTSSPVLRMAGWGTALLMAGAGLALAVSSCGARH